MPKEALKVDWLGAAEISAIQARPIVQQEPIRAQAIEKCRGTCHVRLWYPISGAAAFLENVTRTLRKSATDSEPKSGPMLGIVNDSQSEPGVHWHSLAMGTSTSNPRRCSALLAGSAQPY